MRTAPLIAAVLSLCAAACKTPPPHGFVEVDPRTGRDFEAVSPNGEVFAVSTHQNTETGDLAFWVEAIERELTTNRGYRRRGEVRELSSSRGLPGRELLFDAPPTAGPYVYLVTLFLEERVLASDRLHVVEVALQASGTDARLDELRKSIAERF